MPRPSRDWLWPPKGAPAAAQPLHRDAPADAPVGAPLDRFAYVVDDNDAICRVMALTLATLGVESETFHTAKDALALAVAPLPPP